MSECKQADTTALHPGGCHRPLSTSNDGTVRFAARTAADIAAQLERDAGSLVLTGQSFDKDQHFYEVVAANIREAAGVLVKHQAAMDGLRESYEQAIRAVADRSFAQACGVARTVRDVVPTEESPEAVAWRGGADAIVKALAVRIGLPVRT